MNIVISQKKIAVLKFANEKWQEYRSEQKICKLKVYNIDTYFRFYMQMRVEKKTSFCI